MGSTITFIRERSALLTSNEGFSVVAPTRTTVPSSTCGRNASCWALLKRWISSMKRSVASLCPPRDAGPLDHLADLLHAGGHGAERDKIGPAPRREEPGQGRLAAPRRSPEYDRREYARIDGRSKQRPGAEKEFPPLEFLNCGGAHPIGQGGLSRPPPAGRSGEKILRLDVAQIGTPSPGALLRPGEM